MNIGRYEIYDMVQSKARVASTEPVERLSKSCLEASRDKTFDLWRFAFWKSSAVNVGASGTVSSQSS